MATAPPLMNTFSLNPTDGRTDADGAAGGSENPDRDRTLDRFSREKIPCRARALSHSLWMHAIIGRGREGGKEEERMGMDGGTDSPSL